VTPKAASPVLKAASPVQKPQPNQQKPQHAQPAKPTQDKKAAAVTPAATKPTE
jgi:hypothetical protein